MQAAQSAAAADGLAVPSPQDGLDEAKAQAAMQQARQAMMPPARAPPQQGGSSKKKGPPLRRGKWTVEEEAYANRLIQEFKAGLLPLTDGTTLRTFLSKLLNCDPMRISKKFVGSNCIGKQVFRRRTADLNRLTPEQIQQSRAELSELERRFLERVAQTNRVKSNTVVGGGAATSTAAETPSNPFGVPDRGNPLGMGGHSMEQATPPWLQPPNMYKPGTGASFAAANLSGAANSRAAAAGRAMLGVNQQQQHHNAFEAFKRQHSGGALHSMGQNQQGHSSNSDLLAQLQRQASQSSLFGNSSSNLLAAARNGGFSSQALAQLAQNASAARLASLGSSGNLNGRNSMTDLLSGVGGLSRDQLSKLAAQGSSAGLSSASLSNMMNRQNSFDALMSLDFQSLQSIDNLANLIQTGGSVGNVPQAGMKNADFGNLGNTGGGNSAGDLSAAAHRLASSGRMESLLRSISTSNVGSGGNQTSSANLSNLMKTMQQQQQQQQQQGGASAANLLRQQGRDPSSVSLANLLRQDSSTGLSALRMQEGLNNRNTSVDDFLSLMAAGDIPHQDPSLLNVPLMDQQQGGQQGNNNQQQQQRQFSNAALANALSSRSLNGLGGSGGSNAALFNGGGGDGRSQGNLNAMALAMAQAMGNNGSMSGSKRSLDDYGGDGPMSKRQM